MSENHLSHGLPVIAIGASAGGLEASRALLRDIPGNVQAAFILILHLDPTHDSLMVDLLARHTKLTVVQAVEGAALQSGHLYVIPPGVFLTVAQRIIHLSEPVGGKPVRLPFDVLLRSLAEDAGVCMAIVLTGTGTDGSAGIADIHEAGGTVVAQDPVEAAYSGMPESAIATGFVDQTLPIARIFAALEDVVGAGRLAVAPKDAPDRPAVPPISATSAAYDALIAYVGETTTQDISLYKRGTLERRIARRMALLGLGNDQLGQYLTTLRSDADERAQLSADLLIHVTSFFRDPGVFEHLSKTALPVLIGSMAADKPLRVWVAGCSTGEEAYSLAMVCLEVVEAKGSGVRLQVLASDLDPEAITTARAGFYSKDIEACVSPERLARYFVAENGGWRVTSVLRDVIVFTVADLLADPPFAKIDLVSCRNVLIYLAHEAQKRVIARCCFALRSGGFLLLGAAEMAGQADSGFALEDKDARLWRKVGPSQTTDMTFAIGKREEAAAPSLPSVRRSALADLCRRIVLENYAPAAVLVNSRLECLYFLGPTEKYLKITQGHPDHGIVGMLPKALRARFKAAAECVATKPLTKVSGGHVRGSTSFDIALHAVAAGTEPLLLICFVNSPRPVQAVPTATGQDRGKGDLEADLEAARSDLSDALRDLEQEIEAHGADAAEALSVNEEFQSTNEELLASKEELQSLNEELTALNSQLQETLERHRTTANDLQNVLYSTDVATLFLDLNLNIRFFTPAARAIFRVIPTDVGRPLADLAAVSQDDHLADDMRDVLQSSAPHERETTGAGDMWFMRHIQPYRTEGGRVEGIVITYIDITERKRTNAALVSAMAEARRATRAKSRFLAAASHDLRQPLQSMALLQKLMSRQKRSTEAMRLSELLDQTLHSMTSMLDSMLDVNRIESGNVMPLMQSVAVAPLMQKLIDEFMPQCGVKGLRLRSVPCQAWVRTDPQLLEQILRNLLSNALKYTPKGGILLGCRRRGAVLTILICDSGIGVAEAEYKAIFESYHQVDAASPLSEHGLGLGLSIVQRLAALMEHPVSVRSALGKGSVFMIALPMVAAVADAPMLISPKEAAPQTGTILVVDDEDRLRNLLAEVLANEGHTVIAKATADEALAWVRSNGARPDLLLTDLDLRGNTSGLMLANALPEILGHPVPTIILTGDITLATLKTLGASEYSQVVKPVKPDVLAKMISDRMRSARTARARTDRHAEAAKVTVHVIDDDKMIRDITRRLFEAEGWGVVGYATAEEFLQAPRPQGDACLLVDSLLPGKDGVALITQLRAERVQLPAVMLTGHGDAALAVAALKAGASDLLEKPVSAADLLAAIRSALKTGADTRPQTDQRKAAQNQLAELTVRERQVLTRVLAGEPNKNIAADLGINQRTVENHRASVMRKTGVKSLPALVRLALVANAPAA